MQQNWNFRPKGEGSSDHMLLLPKGNLIFWEVYLGQAEVESKNDTILRTGRYEALNELCTQIKGRKRPGK